MKAQAKIKLNELVGIRVGLPLERKKANPTSINKSEYKALTLKSFANSNSSDDLPYETFIADSEIGSQYLTAENNVIVRLRAPNHAVYINHRNIGLVVPSLMAIIANRFPGVLLSKYLVYCLNSPYIQNQYIKNTQGTSIPMIKAVDLLGLEISLPPIEKQQKVVTYIDTANQEIDLLHKLIDEKNKLRSEVFETLIK